jgi:hypothetical protein
MLFRRACRTRRGQGRSDKHGGKERGTKEQPGQSVRHHRFGIIRQKGKMVLT